MQQIEEHVYVETSYHGGNVGCIVTDQGPILVDTPMLPRENRHWRDQISRVASLPVLYVINTDYRQERILGNAFFDAPVVAHELAWEPMSEYDRDFLEQLAEVLEPNDAESAREIMDLKLVLPQITFTERMMLAKGNPPLYLIHQGGHTPATIAVHLRDEQILFTGDNVTLNALPVLTEADTKQWLQTLTAIRKMRLDTLVPGHGPPCEVEATQQLSAYLRLVRDRVRRHYQAGHSKSELSSLIPQLEDAYPIPKTEQKDLPARIKANLDRVYDEMRARYGKQ